MLKQKEIKYILKEKVSFVSLKLEKYLLIPNSKILILFDLRWYDQFFSEGKKPIMSKIGKSFSRKSLKTNTTKAFNPDAVNKKSVWKKFSASSLKIKIIKFIFNEMLKLRDRFYFEPTLSLLHFIMDKNSRQIRYFKVFAIEYLVGDIENLEKLNVYLEKIQKDICQTYRKFTDSTKNMEAISLNLKVRNKQDIRYHDISPTNFEENPLLSSPSKRKFLSFVLDDEYFFKEVKYGKHNLDISLSYKDFILLLGEIIISQWDKICYILLIFYHFYSKAFSSFFIITYLFVFLCTDEHHSLVRTWQPLFIYIFLIAMAKIIIFLPLTGKLFEDHSNHYLPIYQVKICFFYFNL